MNTPRTDAKIAEFVVAEGDEEAATQFWSQMADFARQLERDLAAVTAECDALKAQPVPAEDVAWLRQFVRSSSTGHGHRVRAHAIVNALAGDKE